MKAEEKLQKLIDETPSGKVYTDDSIYFVIEDGEITEMSAYDGMYSPEIYEDGDGELYYIWEDEYIPLHDNVLECGEPRGEYEDYTDEEWIGILENLSSYEVTGEYCEYDEDDEDD